VRTAGHDSDRSPPALVSAAPLVVEPLPRGGSLREFVQLPWRVNRGDPHWVPPLRKSVRTLLDRDRHPFHRHAEVEYFLARRGGEPVGRVAAIVNHLHNEFHEERTGFFGFFEVLEDAEAAAALLESAAAWLRGRGMDRMRGPTSFSTNEEVGVLVEGFDAPPTVLMTHNPPYYGSLLERAGLRKEKDLLAYWHQGGQPTERLLRGSERIAARAGVRIRTLDLKRFREEVELIQEIYNSAWARNWGFVPMTEAEIAFMARELRPVVDPDLCLFAEVEGKAVGFSLALPDVNQALRKLPSGRLLPFGWLRLLRELRRIRVFRVITLGLRPGYQHSGIGAGLYLRTWSEGLRKGYQGAEASWILQDNLEMVQAIEKMGWKEYKRYRIYERPL
jgi:GNAT superfamily N-acetyltransferase